MDIKIGGVTRVDRPDQHASDNRGVIEAKFLAIRRPRRRRRQRSDGGEERRDRNVAVDPPGSRVILLMVPDERDLPRDLASGTHRVLLRFVK